MRDLIRLKWNDLRKRRQRRKPETPSQLPIEERRHFKEKDSFKSKSKRK
jgi:hypothetical protein